MDRAVQTKTEHEGAAPRRCSASTSSLVVAMVILAVLPSAAILAADDSARLVGWHLREQGREFRAISDTFATAARRVAVDRQAPVIATGRVEYIPTCNRATAELAPHEPAPIRTIEVRLELMNLPPPAC